MKLGTDLVSVERWEHIIGEQGRQNNVRGVWGDPGQFDDFGGGVRGNGTIVGKYGGNHVVLGFIGGGGFEHAQRGEMGGVEVNPEFFLDLAHCSVDGGFTGLGFAAGKHELLGTALANGENLVLRIAKDNSADMNLRQNHVPENTPLPYGACMTSSGQRRRNLDGGFSKG